MLDYRFDKDNHEFNVINQFRLKYAKRNELLKETELVKVLRSAESPAPYESLNRQFIESDENLNMDYETFDFSQSILQFLDSKNQNICYI